jgi:DNA-binding transcriptional ArsR family regulator
MAGHDQAGSAEHDAPAALAAGSDVDEVRVREAQRALASAGDVAAWADRFGMLADVNRLRIALALHCAPGITVSALAEVVGMSDNAVSHALAGLRAAGAVTVERDGRYRRWTLRDPDIHAVLHELGASHSALHPHH